MLRTKLLLVSGWIVLVCWLMVLGSTQNGQAQLGFCNSIPNLVACPKAPASPVKCSTWSTTDKAQCISKVQHKVLVDYFECESLSLLFWDYRCIQPVDGAGDPYQRFCYKVFHCTWSDAPIGDEGSCTSSLNPDLELSRTAPVKDITDLCEPIYWWE
jgi:hypothetical protein